MSAIGSVLAGLIDNAGLYPPATLGRRAAVRTHLNCASSANSSALGRFIVDMNCQTEPRFFRSRADQLLEVRQRFFLSVGSCSFAEPKHGLEALGWLRRVG